MHYQACLEDYLARILPNQRRAFAHSAVLLALNKIRSCTPVGDERFK